MRIIAVLSGKGGVGKSTISTLLSVSLSEKNKVLLLDFDLCGPNIGRTLNINQPILTKEKGLCPVRISPNLSAITMACLIKPTDSVIWRGPKKITALNLFFDSIEPDTDYVIIDTPPGIAEEHYFLLNKGVEAIIISTPQNIALNDATSSIDFCVDNGISIIGVIENMSGFECKCCGKTTNVFGSKGAEMMALHYNVCFLGSINLDFEMANFLNEGSFLNVKDKLETFTAFQDIKEKIDGSKI